MSYNYQENIPSSVSDFKLQEIFTKAMAYALAGQGDTSVIGRVGVLGTLRLYLDFINLFLYVLRLLGRRRR